MSLPLLHECQPWHAIPWKKLKNVHCNGFQHLLMELCFYRVTASCLCKFFFWYWTANNTLSSTRMSWKQWTRKNETIFHPTFILTFVHHSAHIPHPATQPHQGREKIKLIFNTAENGQHPYQYHDFHQVSHWYHFLSPLRRNVSNNGTTVIGTNW